MADNAAQDEYWNGQAGLTWVEAQDRLDAMLAPISRQVLERAAAQAGERVVDIGCGCGDTTLALAATGAAVWGIDLSAAMLARAKARAAGIAHVGFTRADAATRAFTPDHELLFSRFGVMFFEDPVAAFANLRTALTADGRLCFVCWQAPRENAWMAIAGRAVQPFLPEPETPPDPRAPGPFAFADPAYVTGVLTDAGFVDVALEAITPVLHLADDLDAAMRFQGEVGPVARALSELEGPQREAALDAARTALAAHMTDAGLDLGAACWIVTARNG
ncbi:MAG TPA: methyltransferase domain-containing protein [Pseudomonadales bacterium]|nr:methyltransferase domain-containing protein [Pseudomonadales bacterium]